MNLYYLTNVYAAYAIYSLTPRRASPSLRAWGPTCATSSKVLSRYSIWVGTVGTAYRQQHGALLPLRALSEGWSSEIHDIVGVTKERTPRLEPADAHTLSYQTERL